MAVLLIAPVGPDPDPVLVGVREFNVGKLVLIQGADHAAEARALERVLRPLKVEVEVRPIDDPDPILGMLRLISDVVAEHRLEFDDILINVASGGPMLSCAALTAAFVHGVRAFGVAGNKTFPLPVLRFGYRELISDPKLAILRALERADGDVESLLVLSELSGVEKGLLSYHLRGGRDGKGLEELGLIETDRGLQGRLRIRLTPMGRMLLHASDREAAAGEA